MKSDKKIHIQLADREETIDLYTSKTDLFKLSNSSVVPTTASDQEFSIGVNSEVLYAQTADSTLKQVITNKGSGTLLAMIIGNEELYVAKTAGNSSIPFEKSKTELMRFTSSVTDYRLSASYFAQKGGVVYVCSEKGQTISGAQGGNGYIRRFEVPRGLPNEADLCITATFNNPNSNSSGTSGGTASHRNTSCTSYSIIGRTYSRCDGATTSYGGGSSGGVGGKNLDCRLGFVLGADVWGFQTIEVFGGGGGGGYGGEACGYSGCSDKDVGSSGTECLRYNHGCSTASGGSGGLTGAGTGSRVGPSGRTGGRGLSYNANDLNNAYTDWTGSACVIVYKYDE